MEEEIAGLFRMPGDPTFGGREACLTTVGSELDEDDAVVECCPVERVQINFISCACFDLVTIPTK